MHDGKPSQRCTTGKPSPAPALLPAPVYHVPHNVVQELAHRHLVQARWYDRYVHLHLLLLRAPVPQSPWHLCRSMPSITAVSMCVVPQ